MVNFINHSVIMDKYIENLNAYMTVSAQSVPLFLFLLRLSRHKWTSVRLR